MHQGLQFLDIIFLALIAGFIFFRLRSVLGRRTGQERPPTNPYSGRAPSTAGRDDGIRSLPVPEERQMGGRLPGPAMDANAPATPAVARVRAVDPGFDEGHFLEGARSAHEMIVQAFAAGDRATLRDLVAPDVYQRFEAAIADREAKGQHAETMIVGMERAEIADSEVRGSEVSVTVRFVSEIVSFVKDATGQLIEGHPTASHRVTDLWTFHRDTKSRDPNWALVATAGEA